MNLLSNICGLLGIGANVCIYQQKSAKWILILKLTSDILWALHYCFLGAFTAMLVAIIAVIRELVFLRDVCNQKKRLLVLFLFLSAGIISVAVTWKGVFCIFPAMASCLSIFSFWKCKSKLTRYLAVPISVCMIVYDVYCGSVMGICNECFTLISTFVGIFRFRRKTANELNIHA